MCFYCHKLYNCPYAPMHGHDACPEIQMAKVNKIIIETNTYTFTKQNLNPNPNNKTNLPESNGNIKNTDKQINPI